MHGGNIDTAHAFNFFSLLFIGPDVQTIMYNNYSDPDMQIHAPKLTPNDQEALILIQNCNKQELQEFLDNDNKCTDLINDLPQVKRIQTDKEMTIVKNKSMAEYNMSIEPKLISIKAQIAAMYEEANKLKTELAKDKSKLDTVRGELSLDVMNIMLQTEAAKSEEESEKIADNFCEKKMSVDDFLETFVAARTVSHLRQIKSQKMIELVREHSPSRNLAQINMLWNTETKSAAPYPAYSSEQYPSGGYSMPQPNFYAR